MAASVQYNGLASAAQRGDYRVQRKPTELVGGTLDWIRAVEASSRRAEGQNRTANETSGALGRSGIEGTAALGAQSLRSQSDLAATGMQASTSAFNAKTQADALIEREKIARGDQTLEGLKLAAGVGLTAYGIATM